MAIDFLGLPVRRPYMAILRGLTPAASVQAAERVWDIGIELVEVPIQTVAALAAAEAVIRAGRDRGLPVGTGTVLTVDQVRLSKEAGAAFTVAPGFDIDVVLASDEYGIPHLPGVANATDIQQARRAGCTWMKAFPASVLTPGWFAAMKGGPFPGIQLVATGGVDATNAQVFAAAGASMVAFGSSLFDPGHIERVRELMQPVEWEGRYIPGSSKS
jgi:2-dehydro-3-deoxyphosphogluconate aldolase/(4S)-4-hydroxy-2-oxoglutarate aldolase